jgi:hypothetical protein
VAGSQVQTDPTSLNQYLQVRDRILELSVQGKKDETLALFNQKLSPMAFEVKQAGERLLEYNMRLGESRGQAILLICSATQIALAIIMVGIFVLGFFIGLSR